MLIMKLSYDFSFSCNYAALGIKKTLNIQKWLQPQPQTSKASFQLLFDVNMSMKGNLKNNIVVVTYVYEFWASSEELTLGLLSDLFQTQIMIADFSQVRLTQTLKGPTMFFLIYSCEQKLTGHDLKKRLPSFCLCFFCYIFSVLMSDPLRFVYVVFFCRHSTSASV